MQKGEYLLSQEKVGKAVWKLMLPAVLTSMVAIIYNFTDTFFIGLLRDTDQLSALSLAMPLMWLFGTLPGIIAAGAPQVISLKMGAGDGEGAMRTASFCVYGTLALNILFTPVSVLLVRPSLILMGAKGAVLEYAAEYLWIICLGHVFSVGGAALGVLRARGNEAKASIGSAIGIVVNIILDPLFILGLDMGVMGAALATVAGSACSMVYAFVAARGQFSVKMSVPDRETAKKVFGLALSSSVTSVINSLIVAASFSMATGYGDEVVASISVASKLYTFVVTLVSAMCFSLQPFAGYNYAAQNFRRLKKGLVASVGMGTAVCLAGTVLFLAAGEQYMRLFTDDPAVITVGAKMIRYFAIGTPIVALDMAAMMLLSATGKAMRSLAAGLSRQVFIFIPLMVLLRHFCGMDGMIISYPLTDIVSTALALCLCARDLRRIFGDK